MQRTKRFAAGDRFVGFTSQRPSQLGGEGDDRIDLRIDSLDLAQMGFDDFASRQLLAKQTAQELGGGEEAEVGIRHGEARGV